MHYLDRMRHRVEKLENPLVLAIETSCDETSVAVVRGREILANEIASQIPIHRLFGGVVPEIASRKHLEAVDGVVNAALETAGIGLRDLDGIAVTYGPGLVGALLTGVTAAKALAFALDIPLVGVHHIEGHIAANYVQDPELIPPFLCLVVSGGHTHLVKVLDYGLYELMGQTRDDAAGEAFDKVARVLGLPYPGGPSVEQAARAGNRKAFSFPRAFRGEDHLDFSFSGVKTAVINEVNRLHQKDVFLPVADLAASFQETVVDTLVRNTLRAVDRCRMKRVALAGGVAANGALRARMKEMLSPQGIQLTVPDPILCTDNGAMIGCAGAYKLKAGNIAGLDLNAVPSLELVTRY